MERQDTQTISGGETRRSHRVSSAISWSRPGVQDGLAAGASSSFSGATTRELETWPAHFRPVFSCLEGWRGPCSVAGKGRHTECGIPAPSPGVENCGARVAPRNLLTVEECSGSWYTGLIPAYNASLQTPECLLPRGQAEAVQEGWGHRMDHHSLWAELG